MSPQLAIAAGRPAPPCHCGRAIPDGRAAYCSRACRWADADHGPNGDDQ